MREYIIKIWEDEERRNAAESDVVGIGLTDMNDAIQKAKHIMGLNNYASLEVQTQNEKTTVFSITPEDGEQYFHKEIADIKLQDKINKYYDEVYPDVDVEIDSDTILGKVKNIINRISDIPIYSDEMLDESAQLLSDLEEMNKDDVIKIFAYEQPQHYEIKPPNEVLEDLQNSYLEHMKDVRLECKGIENIVEIYFDKNEIKNLMGYRAGLHDYETENLSKLYKEILLELDIPIKEVATGDSRGDGIYEITVEFKDGKKYTCESKAWHTSTEVIREIEDIRKECIQKQEKEMQNKINKYFKVVYPGNILQVDDVQLFGKVKDVIKELKENQEYVNNPENEGDEEWIEFANSETIELLKDLEKKDENDIVRLHDNPMAGFYVICDTKSTLREIQELYLDEMEEVKLENKNIADIVEIYFDRNQIESFNKYENSTDIIETLCTDILNDIGLKYDAMSFTKVLGDVTIVSVELEGKDTHVFSVAESHTHKEITRHIENIRNKYLELKHDFSNMEME